MKLIRFSFACSRKVAFYAHLCNHYLNYPDLWVTVAWKNQRFILEAEGNQAQLEALATAIGHDFLLSLWLTDAKMEEVEARIGSRTAINHLAIQLPFCNHCHPRFSDNQSTEFGQMAVSCPLCHGENHAPDIVKLEVLQEKATELRRLGETTLVLGGNSYHLSTRPFDNGQRSQVLICNPNRLTAHFAAENHHVLALSSLEKPLVTVRSKEADSALEHTLYDLRFAWNRSLSVLAEILRQQGVDYLFYQTSEPQVSVAWVNNQWSELGDSLSTSSVSVPTMVFGLKEPLHDYAIIRGLRADWHKGKVSFSASQSADTSTRESHAICALHGGNVESGILRNSAVIYFSHQSPGQLVALDGRLKTEAFFMLRPLPETGGQLLQALTTGGHSELVERFTAQFREDVDALARTTFSGERDNLTTLYAITAFLLGLATTEQLTPLSKQQLADNVVAAALRYQGKKAHRIDFGFDESNVETNPISGLDFYKTFTSIMAFRLATNGDADQVPKLAFGMMDSLADYLATWIEHLDDKYSVKQVVLAGSEMDNECLTKCIAVRVGNNFPLFANRRLTLDSSNLSVGALLLSQRRRR